MANNIIYKKKKKHGIYINTPCQYTLKVKHFSSTTTKEDPRT
jgi:hypothetical protein